MKVERMKVAVRDTLMSNTLRNGHGGPQGSEPPESTSALQPKGIVLLSMLVRPYPVLRSAEAPDDTTRCKLQRIQHGETEVSPHVVVNVRNRHLGFRVLGFEGFRV